MGGNAIKDACRVGREEYEHLEQKILTKINEYNPAFYARSIPYYKNKQDFGDIDILISSSSGSNPQDIPRKIFHSEEVVKNGNVQSFRLRLDSDRVFQVDTISVPYEDLDVAKFYFSYNDLNLLTGRIAHKLGLKFGFDGLVLKIRTESGHAGLDINLTKDPRRIYDFLGYDYNRYLQGFNNLEEVYEFVASTKYFNPFIFDYEQLNHINKTRNRKRATYAGFLEWISHGEGFNQYQFQQKQAYLIKTHCAFPEIDIFGQIKEYACDYHKNELLKNKFNGNLVMSWIPGLQGKELGQAISGFRKYIECESGTVFSEAIKHMPTDVIKEYFQEWYRGN